MVFRAIKDDEMFRPVYKLDVELTGFMVMNVKMAEVDWQNHYMTTTSAVNSLNKGAKRHLLPIKAYMRKGKVYLVRTDTE